MVVSTSTMLFKLNTMKTAKNILSIFILPLLILSLQHCKEDDPLTELEKLPPATQSGKRTFGCLVDGKAMANDGCCVPSDYQLGLLSIVSGASNKDYEGLFSIYVHDNDLSEKSYILSESGLNQDYARFYETKVSCEFLTDNAYTGSITITHLDKINFIISGTFEFELYSADCTKVIKVTDGRFDTHYSP